MEAARPEAPIGYGIVQVGPYVRGGVPVLAIRDLLRPSTRTAHRSSPAVEAPYRRSRVVPGDLLISVKGTTGRVGLVPDGFEGNISRDIARVRLRSEHNPRYWLHLLRSDGAQSILQQAAVGTTRQELSIATLRTLRFRYPDQVEQDRLVATLDDIDDQVAALERLIAKREAIKQGMMQQLLTGRTRLPGFVDAWITRRIGDFANVRAGGTPSTAVDAYWGGRIPWMSSGEIHKRQIYEVRGRITPLGLEKSSAQLFPPGTVLMALAGQGKTRGTVAVSRIELATNQSIAGIYPSNEHDPDYLCYNLETRYLELRGESAGDGGRGGLNLTIIKRVEVPLPGIDEQLAIARVLLDADAELQTLERRLTKARAIKTGMMQQLLTGRVRLPVETAS